MTHSSESIPNKPADHPNADEPSAVELLPPPSEPPPKGPRIGRVVGVIVLLVVALVIGAAIGPRLSARLQTQARHEADGHDHSADVIATDGKPHYYTCAMHPWVVLPEPGLCPICHMQLEPIDPNKFTGEVTIDPVMVQNIGVRIEPVATGPLTKTIRTVGTIEYAEPLVRDVNTKIGGWIEKLDADRMGQHVRAGEALFELYSPELYAAQEEYLLAYRGAQSGNGQYNGGLLEAARTRLAYFDISSEEVSVLEKAGKASKTMTIRARHDGVVIEKNVNEGMRIEPGTLLYRIADLSRLWVMVTVYEYQLPFVEQGQAAVMSLSYIPGQTFDGKVAYVYPYLDQKLRQVKVRVEFDNPTGLLKPGMYVNVELQNTLAQDRVLVPRSAVIDTGTRQIAFVSQGNGHFEPRQVQLGVETEDGMVEVRDGLKAGENVVVSGQFLIDSEARLRESLAKMIQGQPAEAPAHAVASDSAGPTVTPLPEDALAALAGAVEGYLQIGQTLSQDSIDGIKVPAQEIADAVNRLLEVPLPQSPHFWHEHDEVATVRGKALEMLESRTMEQARLAYADMSVAMAKLLGATGVPLMEQGTVELLHCPMFLAGQGGGTWLQVAGVVRNPFFGSKMLGCFDKRESLPAARRSDEVRP